MVGVSVGGAGAGAVVGDGGGGGGGGAVVGDGGEGGAGGCATVPPSLYPRPFPDELHPPAIGVQGWTLFGSQSSITGTTLVVLYEPFGYSSHPLAG